MKSFSTLLFRALTLAALLHSATGWTQGCTLTCPANITQSNDLNQCGAVVTYPAPTTTGTCGTITATPASGSFFPAGPATTVTATATPPTGGTVSCTFTITVNDTQPPQITCPANISILAPPGQSSAVVTFPLTASDNCPGVTLVSNPPSGSVFPAGTTPDTALATDGRGNTASCSFNILVVANLPHVPVPMVNTIGLIVLGLGLAFAAAFGLRRRSRR